LRAIRQDNAALLLWASGVIYGSTMNKINPKKLLKSKWTAAEAKNREKHFMVTEVEFDEAGMVISCFLEAIISRRSIPIQWHDLKDKSQWIHGWK
jgi:tryptophan-rich hypothetical protein